MSLWRHVTRGLRGLTQRAAADRDLADEVEHYREQAVASHVGRGLTPQAARPPAQLELGNATVVRGQGRRAGWGGVPHFACRRALRGGPAVSRRASGFTTVAVLTLAIGIGGTTAIQRREPDSLRACRIPMPAASCPYSSCRRKRSAEPRRHVSMRTASSRTDRAPRIDRGHARGSPP